MTLVLGKLEEEEDDQAGDEESEGVEKAEVHSCRHGHNDQVEREQGEHHDHRQRLLWVRREKHLEKNLRGQC